MSVTFVVVSVALLCFRPIFPFSSFLPFLFIGGFDSSALCRSRRELSNEYLLPKFGFQLHAHTWVSSLFFFYERDCSILLACLLASIQPRTSPFKFARSPRTDPPGMRRCLHCSSGGRCFRKSRRIKLPSCISLSILLRSKSSAGR